MSGTEVIKPISNNNIISQSHTTKQTQSRKLEGQVLDQVNFSQEAQTKAKADALQPQKDAVPAQKQDTAEVVQSGVASKVQQQAPSFFGTAVATVASGTPQAQKAEAKAVASGTSQEAIKVAVPLLPRGIEVLDSSIAPKETTASGLATTQSIQQEQNTAMKRDALAPQTTNTQSLESLERKRSASTSTTPDREKACIRESSNINSTSHHVCNQRAVGDIRMGNILSSTKDLAAFDRPHVEQRVRLRLQGMNIVKKNAVLDILEQQQWQTRKNSKHAHFDRNDDVKKQRYNMYCDK